MKYSKLFGKTSKNVASDADSVNAKLLTQAAFIQKQISGVYNFLPLGLRVLTKIQNIIREEMNKIGGQEVLMPAMTQEENWITTGRNTMDVLFHLKGQGDTNLVLNPTHEEVITPLVQKYVFSYRDLPVALYQIQNKYRNEARAKSGLLRGREFSMKDLYSFHVDEADLNRYYDIVKQAYFKIYERIGIGGKTVLTFSSGGNFSQFSHEFQTLNEGGEDTIYLCSKCRVAVNKEIINTQKTCPECGNDKLEAVKATEVGNIFKLRTKFSDAFKFFYSDSQGKEKIVEMGCYGMGPSRVMGTVVELCHDDAGIIWPKNIAPYQVHLVGLDGLGEDLYQELLSKNIDVLFDDRDIGAGAKFADADLIGIPVRLVASKRSQEKGGIEFKLRSEKESEIIEAKDLVSKITSFYN
ncbi:MAG: Prolyl-tRNA synthetase [Candidatus Shapirobacteria bacterium GW2011_GWE1_38_10]|uniref:Proline--tRNA ligase n=1 Tax=Candidatus Shapirobacteria bacterium GW2011_GWE1_38_10 TaxID=1618488 RepID=A0A0G0LBA6_9BACT|nr:MAG: Prolyl-tRNA synthetase [Candidatus Shapirobacteria bacterium GW2011_GWF2_37_20]KKQ49966.1 MAG: Prolyl-tRNA synthetase [Candidatus Shapirobacteria bacterium GW2011_GWE1_38_10]KKQ63954.1 MAG: Prolyl-tRNA synthetase [Candidatus Shapirobacteria bacterium GW2011_GWF1_38_23]